eukprot:CAMPEP_0119551786 /NCGR_PEP_ID=MMETSP1352-20130426/4943_1 /TAXON_ID=265584 /ORGANISM="Stauroneis constricta, Strain CCMP1120" /LENGTH=451 /DNA_ID=CAMNT_0007597901 /DNA_START=102 /DNA_END=1457 /DNA_ORIENTATION=-
MSNIGHSGRAAGGELEEKVDYSKEADEKIEEAKKMANVEEGVTLLAALEKKCRVGNDNPSLVRVCKASLELCKENTELLLTTLDTLVTRRSQKTQAVRACVETTMPWCIEDSFTPIDMMGDKAKEESRDKLVVALRDITDGKIFLEGERARLTRALAIIKEQNGDIGGAADVLQEVHVETYGSLSKKEKVEFILEQMRLTLGKKDFVRAAIVAGKISKKQFKEKSMTEYKIKYYTLLAEYHRSHTLDALELAKCYHEIYSSSTDTENDEDWQPSLQATVLFLTMSPHGNEQQDMFHHISQDANLEKMPPCDALVKLFLKKELIAYPLANQAEIESWPAFTEGDLAKHWKDVFHTRVIQNNIRIASLYYRRIHGKRLAQLLRLPIERLEREIATMVSDGTVYARIDRPKDIIRFSQPKSPEAVLTEWSSNVDKLLHLVETTTHLISKENMVS